MCNFQVDVATVLYIIAVQIIWLNCVDSLRCDFFIPQMIIFMILMLLLFLFPTFSWIFSSKSAIYPSPPSPPPRLHDLNSCGVGVGVVIVSSIRSLCGVGATPKCLFTLL